NPAFGPQIAIIRAGPTLDIAFPSAMGWLVIEYGDQRAVGQQRQIRPGTDIVNCKITFHRTTPFVRYEIDIGSEQPEAASERAITTGGGFGDQLWNCIFVYALEQPQLLDTDPDCLDHAWVKL